MPVLFRPTFLGGKGFSELAYHYLMGKDGTVFAGRELEGLGLPGGAFTKGSHVDNNNTNAGIGVCLLGDYEGTEGNEAFPNRRQFALERIISGLCRRHNIASGSVKYHQEMALAAHPSLCPGSNVIPRKAAIVNHVGENLK